MNLPPNGFFWVRTSHGKVLCYFCSACSQLFRGVRGPFRHCGKTEKLPSASTKLPTCSRASEHMVVIGTSPDVLDDIIEVE